MTSQTRIVVMSAVACIFTALGWQVIRSDEPTTNTSTSTESSVLGDALVNDSVPLFESTANFSRRVDLSISFSMALETNAAHYSRNYGKWNSSCLCRSECIAEGQAERQRQGSVADWGDRVLDQFIDDMIRPWNVSGGISLHHHASMLACAFHSRSRHNPSGIWLHVSGRNTTVLRKIVDGYQRQKRIEQYVRDVIAHAAEPLPPMVAYISTTDIPCNPNIPYLSFFSRRGVKGIMIPDDSFVGGMQKNWSAANAEIRKVANVIPYQARKSIAFFRGSPTHLLRQQVMEAAASPTLINRTDVKLAVMEKFKSLAVPLINHTAYRYLIAIRGRTASSRDKYLNAIGSTILWAFPENDSAADQSWFQFYHALWKPWVNYVPFTPSTLKCTLDLLDQHEEPSRQIAESSEQIASLLTQKRVDAHLLRTLRAYASLQQYEVQSDPVEFLRTFFYFSKKWYRNAQIKPDNRAPVKFHLASWVKRRIQQITSCRKNATQTFAYHNPTGCWYT